MGLWLLLTLRFAVLCACATHSALHVVAIFALAAAWGRWTAAPLLRWLPALGDGLSKDIRSDARLLPGVVASGFALLATAGAWWVRLPHACAAAGAAIVVTALWGLYLHWRLGGQSGDLLGAGNQLVEAVVLLVMIAGGWGTAGAALR
ncbi:MAG: adenosylcobinamide-GDP ribazoletransferase, partial [Planctomycetes bacterium]|nr:adenosylcobinamide-GDP ribazoletransferase [Planctomycetota bacterium]